MIISIWVDWNNQIVYTTEDELKTEWNNLIEQESDIAPMSFPEWLDENFMPSTVWDANTNERYAIEQDYEAYCKDCYDNWVETYLAQLTLTV